MRSSDALLRLFLCFVAMGFAACKPASDSETKAITGSEGGKEMALALLAVNNLPESTLPDNASGSTARVVNMVRTPVFALVQCSAGGGLTATKLMRKLEGRSMLRNLLVDYDRRLLTLAQGADGSARRVYFPCTIIGDRMASWPVISDALQRLDGIPKTKPADGQLEAARLTYKLAQSIYLAVRGPHDFEAKGPAAGEMFTRLIEAMEMYDGPARERVASLGSWFSEADSYFNPCIAGRTDLWYVKEWKNQNYSCDRNGNVADFRAEGGSNAYKSRKFEIAMEISATHAELFHRAGSNLTDVAVWDVLTSARPMSMTANGGKAFAAVMAGKGKFSSLKVGKATIGAGLAGEVALNSVAKYGASGRPGTMPAEGFGLQNGNQQARYTGPLNQAVQFFPTAGGEFPGYLNLKPQERAQYFRNMELMAQYQQIATDPTRSPEDVAKAKAYIERTGTSMSQMLNENTLYQQPNQRTGNGATVFQNQSGTQTAYQWNNDQYRNYVNQGYISPSQANANSSVWRQQEYRDGQTASALQTISRHQQMYYLGDGKLGMRLNGPNGTEFIEGGKLKEANGLAVPDQQMMGQIAQSVQASNDTYYDRMIAGQETANAAFPGIQQRQDELASGTGTPSWMMTPGELSAMNNFSNGVDQRNQAFNQSMNFNNDLMATMRGANTDGLVGNGSLSDQMQGSVREQRAFQALANSPQNQQIQQQVEDFQRQRTLDTGNVADGINYPGNPMNELRQNAAQEINETMGPGSAPPSLEMGGMDPTMMALTGGMPEKDDKAADANEDPK